jgi:starvation-inducible DNA-binding protein
MKQTELMNKYVADLMVLYVKFHNLHWNVTGKGFEQVHVYIEKLYDDLTLKYDEVAERVKMLGEYPTASIASYKGESTIEEIESKDYTISESLNIVLAELKYLKGEAQNIRKVADENDDFVTVAMMEDHIAVYDKEIWFVKQTLK